MHDRNLEELLTEMRGHELEVARLERTLAALGPCAPRLDRRAELFVAQMTKHRISLALLTSRLPAMTGAGGT